MQQQIKNIKYFIKNIKLNPPLSEDEVIIFERAHDISLPLDYRTFSYPNDLNILCR